MKFNTKLVLEILGTEVLKHTVKTFIDYEWLDVVSVSGSPNVDANKLIFASHEESNDWHFGFDRRGRYSLYIEKNHVVVDFDTDQENSIIVKSINESVKLLYEYVTNLYRSRISVIGVTGSVGKTTTVGFIEHLIKKSQRNVVRFYSKRIFPLSLMAHFINKVNKQTEYIVLEYSLFYKDHIEILSSILAPDFAYIMNILNMHIEERLGFANTKDIFKSKSKIYVKGVTKKLYLHNSIVEYQDLLQDGEFVEIFKNNDSNDDIESMPPTVRTQQMVSVGISVILDILGLQAGDFKNLSSDYNPVESRMILYKNQKGQRIYFHGETSTAERMRSLIETAEDNPCYLFVDEINFSQADPACFWNELRLVFEREFTYVLDSEDNRLKLGDIKANYLLEHEFLLKLRSVSGYIAYHKSMFVRQDSVSVQDYLFEKVG